MSMTVPELAVIFLLLFAAFHYLGIFLKIRSVLGFLGVVTLGAAGFLGRIADDLGTWAQHTFGSILSWAIGVPFAAGLFIVLAVLLVHALHPKNGAPKHTGWIAVALGVLIVSGVAGIEALSGVRGDVLSIMSGVVTTINSA